ncbi:MAG: hypothetical protein RR481_00730 [Longicatena sp.]
MHNETCQGTKLSHEKYRYQVLVLYTHKVRQDQYNKGFQTYVVYDEKLNIQWLKGQCHKLTDNTLTDLNKDL